MLTNKEFLGEKGTGTKFRSSISQKLRELFSYIQAVRHSWIDSGHHADHIPIHIYNLHYKLRDKLHVPYSSYS